MRSVREQKRSRISKRVRREGIYKNEMKGSNQSGRRKNRREKQECKKNKDLKKKRDVVKSK